MFKKFYETYQNNLDEHGDEIEELHPVVYKAAGLYDWIYSCIAIGSNIPTWLEEVYPKRWIKMCEKEVREKHYSF